jgi:hypothetical protein
MGMGFLIFIPLWALKLRDRPAKSMKELMETFNSLTSVATYQSLTHASGVIALGSGAVSFTQGNKLIVDTFNFACSELKFLFCLKL